MSERTRSINDSAKPNDLPKFHSPSGFRLRACEFPVTIHSSSSCVVVKAHKICHVLAPMTLSARFIVPALAGFFVVASIHAQNITVQVGGAASPPTSLIDHTNTWRWHKGTNAPQASWQTVADGTLNTDWSSGP